MRIKTVGAPSPASTHGGPVFMSIGQVIQLDLAEEKTRRLEGDSTDPAVAPQPDSSVGVTSVAAQEPTTSEPAANSLVDPATSAVAPANTTPSTTAPKITAGTN